LLLLPAQVRAEDAFLWKIEAPSGTVYLLGSIHAADKSFYPLPKIVDDAFRRSDNLVVEVNIAKEENTEQAINMFLDTAVYPSGDTLQKHISRETFKKVMKQFEIYAVDDYRIQKLRPWALGMLLSSLELHKSSADSELGIDLHFIKRAMFLKKTILELETMELQAKLFDGLSDQEQEAYLLAAIQGIEGEVEGMDTLMDIWKRGDLAALEKWISGSALSRPELGVLNSRILTKRNVNMVARIEDLIKDRGIDFVVVGAAHLIGKGSIVQLLRTKGYTVDRM
jgi:uncharacterized protein